jgi:uncharacterized protein (TIGR03067 family)
VFATLLVLAFVVTGVDSPEDKELSAEAKKELKKLEGRWKGEKVITSQGEEVPPDDMGTIEFKGRKVLLGDKEVLEIAALDPTVDPKILDVKALMQLGELQKDTVYESIYKLDGDTMTWAIHIGEGKKRPANFDNPKDAGVVLVILKRVKE